MLLLLSPSKTQDFSTAAPTKKHTIPALLKESQLLIKELKKYSAKDIAALMDLSEKLSALNTERYQKFCTPLTPKNAKQAMFAFQGDVYDGLDATHLSTPALSYVTDHLRIISGLYGLLRPLDLIQPYRLEMSIPLPNPRGKNLYLFWKEVLRIHLAQEMKLLGTDILINLASQEYADAITPPKGTQVITPQFKERKGKEYKVIGLFAKKARGQMVRFIASSTKKTPETLLTFAEDGYRYNVKLSTASTPVFTRG